MHTVSPKSISNMSERYQVKYWYPDYLFNDSYRMSKNCLIFQHNAFKAVKYRIKEYIKSIMKS